MTSARPGSALLARSVGPLVALAGLAPFLVAWLLWRPTAEGGLSGFGLSGSCQLLEHTGIPCAGCGASRAIFHFAHGDSAFVDYNWFWVGALLALLVWGGVLTMRGLRGGPLLGRRLRWLVQTVAARPALAGVFTVAFLAVPWSVALVNLDALRGG
jgi:hypothetical protein